MSLRSAAKLTKGIADDSERAVRAASAFPGLGAAGLPGPAAGGGLGLNQLREALAPLIEGIGAVRDIVDVPPGGVELADRMNTA